MRFLAPENFDTPKHNKQGHVKLGIKENQEWKREARRKKDTKKCLEPSRSRSSFILTSHLHSLFPQADPRESFFFSNRS